MKRTSVSTWVLGILILSLTGCGTLQRSADSGYAFREDTNQGRDRRAYSRDAAAHSLGLKESQDYSGQQRDAITYRAALMRAEKSLEGKREREQYFKNKAYMKSDQERLEYLRVPTYGERTRWLEARGIQGAGTKQPPEIQDLIDQNDITVGMTKQAVREAWGEPELIEVAGSPMYGNERWTYSEQIASHEGFHGETRTVLFDSGRVVGWETR